MFDPIHNQEVASETWMQQRAQYRRENRLRLRQREGLPAHDGERYVIGSERVGLAVGVQKGKDFESAARDTGFDHVLSAPADLVCELLDLDRDAANLALAEGVRHVDQEYAPVMSDNTLEDEDALDGWMQQELLRRRGL